jgi:hypothetical protein
MNTLYYSTRCPHCKQLIEQYNLNEFTMISVDNVAPDRLPSYVTMVPTVITPDKMHKYEGREVFDYVQRTSKVEPYAFDMSNNTNKGFSFIGNDHYTEQNNFCQLTDIGK